MEDAVMRHLAFHHGWQFFLEWERHRCRLARVELDLREGLPSDSIIEIGLDEAMGLLDGPPLELALKVTAVPDG